jgi:predicted phage-related endonuclease
MRIELRPPRIDAEREAALAAWKEVKRGKIGGSSAAAAIGLGRYGSRLRLWAQMTGKLESPQEETAPMRWGNLLESSVIEEIGERTDYRVTLSSHLCLDAARWVGDFAFRTPAQELWASRERPWQCHSPDGFVVTFDGWAGLLEAKTTGLWAAGDWGDEPPEHVIVQCQHGMAVFGLPFALVPVLIAGQDWRLYRVERDEVLIEALNARERAFMDCVAGDVRPPFEDPFNDDTLRVLKALHPSDNGETVELGEDAHRLLRDLEAHKAERKKSDAAISELEAHVRALMGDATYGRTPEDMEGGHYELSLKTVTRKAYSVAESSYRAPRVKWIRGQAS